MVVDTKRLRQEAAIRGDMELYAALKKIEAYVESERTEPQRIVPTPRLGVWA